jgi:tRNA(fMet)-specific endonuclease VapC
VALRIALDTNAYSNAARNDPRIRQVLEAAERIFLPFVVVGELRAGFAAGKVGRQNEAGLVRFLSSPRVEVLYADEQTTHHYATIFVQLRRAGTPIPTNDLWIAALAVQNDLVLCSADHHFAHLPQLSRA